MKPKTSFPIGSAKMDSLRFPCDISLKEEIIKRMVSVGGEGTCLRVAGDATILLEPRNERPRIFITGTRDIDSYGRDMIGRILSALEDLPVKPLVLTTCSVGTSGRVIEEILSSHPDLPLAVMMYTGFERIYPYTMTGMIEQVAERPNSAVMTMMPDGTMPTATGAIFVSEFLAAFADAVVVPECKARGSAMLAARFAHGCDTPVFAVPGRVGDSRSVGTNNLISYGVADGVWDMVEFRKKLENNFL